MEKSTILELLITQRRSIKPANMSGKKIPDPIVHHLLELADWAPTHGYTEPWYFIVYSGEKVQEFCTAHAELYKNNTPAEKYTQFNYDKLHLMGTKASHVIVACMKRGDNPKIPEVEEVEAVACAVQNLLLAATAYDLASFWSSGGMTYSPALHHYLELGPADKVLGLLYLGYPADELPAGRRIKPLTEKVKWVK
ncbi:MAG TPA: nitroreductase [Chitinophaga sp.]